MIIRENEHSFILIPQHEHGQLSGHCAMHWGDIVRTARDGWSSVITACREHDRGWQEHDQFPQWNHDAAKPYDFTTYPEENKVELYENGIREIALLDRRAGYLVSQHLQSFFTAIHTDRAKRFKEREAQRQHAWQAQIANVEDLQNDLAVLRMCDELSLYICMNEPGVPKAKEMPWFRKGFSQTFSFLNDMEVKAFWRDERKVVVTPFPLDQPVAFPLKSYTLEKTLVKERGLLHAFLHCPLETSIFEITNA